MNRSMSGSRPPGSGERTNVEYRGGNGFPAYVPGKKVRAKVPVQRSGRAEYVSTIQLAPRHVVMVLLKLP